jgi:NAD+ kinase
MASVALFLHHERAQAAELAAGAARWLLDGGHQVCLPEHDATLAGHPELAADEATLGAGLDLAVSLGGDGTMLRTVRAVADQGAAVLGVHVGQLGYLTEVEPEQLHLVLEQFMAGRCRIEERMRLAVRVEPDGIAGCAALNEAVLEKTPLGHTVRLAVTIGKEYFTTYATDGLILATPTGSTAYSFSARGPIVDPAHRAVLLTPVSPHMLFDRTLVLAPDVELRITVDGHRPAALFVDGQLLGQLEPGQSITGTASPRSARVVTMGERDFHRTLKAKFGLNDR